MNALSWHTEFVEKHREEFEQMSDKDKNWNRVKNGFFILLSNIDTSCEEILNRYIERVNIESHRVCFQRCKRLWKSASAF